MNPITQLSGPCVVLAGAGTGKTHMIVEKIKYMLQKKVCKPEEIVCITFSNEAANNLVARVRKFLPENAQEPIIKTFHSFSSYLLKKHAEKIGIKKEFHTLTPDDAKVLLHTNLKVTASHCHQYVDAIGKAKDLGITVEKLKELAEKKGENRIASELATQLEYLQLEFHRNAKENTAEKKKLLEKIKEKKTALDLLKFSATWQAYERIKEKRGALDYADLNTKSLQLLQQNPEISGEFTYVIVDEFQDTNRVQLEFLVHIAPHKNITVVGDMNQSIYRFRGAYEKNLEYFKKMFDVTNANIYNLDKSYRSPNKILRVAHQLIQNNYANHNDCFFVDNISQREGSNIQVIQLKNAQEEARKIVEIIQEEMKEKPLEEICVMARAHQHLRIIKKSLEEAQIQFHSVGKESLLKQKSIKTISSYLRILNSLQKKDSSANDAWWELMHQSNLEKSDFIRISLFLKENKETPNSSVKLFNTLSNLELSPHGKIAVKSIIEKIKKALPSLTKPLKDVIEETSSFPGFDEIELANNRAELMNIAKFAELAKIFVEQQYDDLNAFLTYLDVIETLGITIEAAGIENKGVRLMTVHATKGLEFKTVILTNLAQKRFPIERITTSKLLPEELFYENMSEEEMQDYERHNQLLEERRLCYVSFTRAKEKLILTYAQNYSGKSVPPSQFLDEIEYKKNQDISFVQDTEEKVPEKKLSVPFVLEETNQINLLDPFAKTFSPSALLLFEDCQKKFEYKYVYNMPEKRTVSWEMLKSGSFIHHVLENGVKNNYKTLKEFTDFATDAATQEEWSSLNLEEIMPLIKIFFERNKSKYSKESLTEQYLHAHFSGLKFMGRADRIDFVTDGVEIIDYKTGKTVPSGKDRNWQLGFYALAAEKYGRVAKLTLEVLQNHKALEFELDENGNAKSTDTNRIMFNIYDVKAELVGTANKIIEAYKNGFNACSIQKNCEFCQEYVY